MCHFCEAILNLNALCWQCFSKTDELFMSHSVTTFYTSVARSGSYLSKVRVGVEATLVAHHGAAQCASVEAWPVISSASQVGRFTDGAQLTAGHGRYLRHRIRRGREAGSVRGHRRGPPSPAATHIHV